MLLHVVAPALKINDSAHASSLLEFRANLEVVQHTAMLVLLDFCDANFLWAVHHKPAGVEGLASALRVEGAAVEHHRRPGAGTLDDIYNFSFEFGQK